MRAYVWGLSFLALVFVIAGTASATHYRYGTLSWEPTENANEVRFTGGQAWRGSAFGSPAVGQIVGGEGCIDTGDGNCIPIFLKVNARSVVNDYFSATFVDSFGNEGIRHTYASANNGGVPWSVTWGSCCRISPHSSGNFHVNNPDQSESLQTYVDLASGNSAPKSTLPPINACPREGFCTIPIPATDSDQDVLSFRLSTTSEAGDLSYTPPGPPDATHAAMVDATSGLLTWDTHGATVGDPSEHTLYSVQVMIEDDFSQTPLDFFIEIIPFGTSPPYWVSPPTPCGQTISVDAGTPVSFDVRAKSDDPVRVVSVSHLGLPLGATFPPVTPGNPASGTFSWTPTLTQGGSFLVVFAAEDDLGYPAPACPVTINVGLHAPPTFTIPAQCGAPATMQGVIGMPIAFPVAANTSNLSRTVTISLESGPIGLVFPTTAPGNPTSGIATWPAPYPGAPPARFLAVDSMGVKARCTVPFDIDVPAGQALSLGAWAGTATPAAVEYSSGGFDVRSVGASSPVRTKYTAWIDDPALGLHAEGITEWAGVLVASPTATSIGGSEIEMLSLGGGALVLHGVRQEAAVSWDAATSTPTIERSASIARITLGGMDVTVPPQGEVTIALPTGGSVALFGASTNVGARAVAIEDAIAHVYAAPQLGRHEAILGSIVLQAGLDVAPRGQTRSILVHDDLRSGADAGTSRASAMDLPIGAADANMPAGDAVDAYVFQAAHGEKIVFAAQPAPGAFVTGGSASWSGTPPPGAATPTLGLAPLESWQARLFDPTGALRERSLVVAGGAARVELNADLTGEWLVLLDRTSSALTANYTLALSITPVPLLPQNDALSLADAAPLCIVNGAGIPTVSNGVWPGVVRDDDFADTYRFSAEIGEILTVTLKPGEDADGASMGLELYDRGCNILQSMMTLTSLVKGEPRVTFQLPSLYTGDYYARIVRLNGVANHYLDVSVVNPMPTAPMNDALTGQDATDDPAQASAAPAGAFQGRIHEGDTGDAYRLRFEVGGEAVVGFSMSALSQVNVELRAPDGTLVFPTTGVGSTALVWRFTPDLAGDHTLRITPSFGGGNYAVTWGQEPAQAPV